MRREELRELVAETEPMLASLERATRPPGVVITDSTWVLLMTFVVGLRLRLARRWSDATTDLTVVTMERRWQAVSAVVNGAAHARAKP